MPVLRPEDHMFFLERGFIILKKAVPPDTIAAAIASLEAGSIAGTPVTLEAIDSAEALRDALSSVGLM